MKIPKEWGLCALTFLTFVKTSIQDCGHDFERTVMCGLNPDVTVAKDFDFKLFTHCLIDATIYCREDVCKYLAIPAQEKLIDRVLPLFPRELGIYLTLNSQIKSKLITAGNEMRRTNTIDGIVEYLEEKGLTFIVISLLNQRLASPVERDNYLLLLKELSEKLHKRGLYLGQRIDIDEGNIFMVNFNNTEVSKLVDWFYIIPAKLDHQGFMEPYTPLKTYNGKSSGTLEYWIKKMLETIKAECILIDLGPRVKLHRRLNSPVQPGPGSFSQQRVIANLGVSKVCHELQYKSELCQEYWHEGSNTPWAVCGNDFYTYDNARSLKLKADFLKEYNISGVLMWGDDVTDDNLCGNGDRMAIFKAVQGMREL